MRFILILAVLALAGCAAAPTSQPPPPALESATLAPEVFLLDGNSNITAAGGYELNGPNPFNSFRLRIPYQENATAVLAELAWSDTTQDLDIVVAAYGTERCGNGGPEEFLSCSSLVVFQAGNDGYVWNMEGSAGAPDSPSIISLSKRDVEENLARCSDMDECGLQVGVRTKEGAVNVAWTMAVSVFHDGEVPEGYSALSS